MSTFRRTPRQRRRVGPPLPKLVVEAASVADQASRLPAAVPTVPVEDSPAVLGEIARTVAGLRTAAAALHQRLEEHFELVEIYKAVPSQGRDWGEAGSAAEEAAEHLADAHTALVDVAERTQQAVRLPRSS